MSPPPAPSRLPVVGNAAKWVADTNGVDLQSDTFRQFRWSLQWKSVESEKEEDFEFFEKMLSIKRLTKERQTAERAKQKKCKKNHVSDNVLICFCIYI